MVSHSSPRLSRSGLLAACIVVVGCAGASVNSGRNDLLLQAAPVSYVSLSDTLPIDPHIAALVLTYRAQLIEQMSRVVGRATARFDKARPEGALGNLVADAMLHVVQDLVDDSVDVAVTNNGGIRVPVREGPITVGDIFEMAPFENLLTVIELTGEELQALADDIAQIGGEPIAGFSFHIDNATGRAGGLRVGSEAVRKDRIYRVVTLDYLVDGGDMMRTLWTPRSRVTTDVLLRNAIIQYIDLRGEIRPVLEDRIVHVAR